MVDERWWLSTSKGSCCSPEKNCKGLDCVGVGECGGWWVWGLWSVGVAECGGCGVWELRSVGVAECGVHGAHFSSGDWSLFLGKLQLFFLFLILQAPKNAAQKKVKKSMERIFCKFHFLFFLIWWWLQKVEKADKYFDKLFDGQKLCKHQKIGHR